MEHRQISEFQEMVWDYYHAHGRDLPWRQKPFDPYRILVSEIMLQQTQVTRVIPKYQEFLLQFPDVHTLAKASLADVITAWSGLGYNRRAKYLYDAAKRLAPKPIWTFDDLTACKGIGLNTAAAVLVYTYNKPIAFVETNIRSTYIHHFFAGHIDVTDRELLPLVRATLDPEHPREFMWALMDYGSHLKNTIGNTARSSKHYAKQSRFEGSRRQIRGRVLRLLANKPAEVQQLQTGIPDKRLPAVLDELQAEGLVTVKNKHYQLFS